MKKSVFLILLMLISAVGAHVSMQGIDPNTDNAFNLGSSTKTWQNLYLGTGLFICSMSGTDVIKETSGAFSAVGSPVKNYVLMYNGSTPVWVAPAAGQTLPTFTFSITSFSDGESTTQLIGSGVWKAVKTMSYTSVYANGPPTTADVNMSINGAAYAKVGTMTAPVYTTGTNTESAINYPAAKDQYLRFYLYATDGVDSDTEYETLIYFRNYIWYGDGLKANTYLEADVEAETAAWGPTVAQSVTINAGVGEYLMYAYPATYTSIPVGSDYEDSGNAGTGFVFNSITCACIQDTATLSITNTAGYAENYKVYVSTLANLGNSTLTTYTTATAINYIYAGSDTDTADTEAMIEAMDTKATGTGITNGKIASNTKNRTFAVTPGASEYIWYGYPKRLGTSVFTVGGFEGGFEAPETLANVGNSNGWTEDYYCYRSSNIVIGATTVVVSD